MLAVGQERRAGEQVRVPEWDFAAGGAGQHNLLPCIVLDDEVADKGVMGHGGGELVGRGLPRRPLEQVVGRQVGARADRDLGIEQQRQNEISQSDQYVRPHGAQPFAKSSGDHAMGSFSMRKTQAAAPTARHSVWIMRNSWPRPKVLSASCSRPTVRKHMGAPAFCPQHTAQRSME